MAEKDSIIDEIYSSKNFDAVYMTTYNFEVSFFEKYLIHLFLNNNIRYINLFVDSKQLNYALEEEIPLHFGRKYYVSPMDFKGSFHPKVILMLGDQKAKLIVSSANIKLSGYMTNSEIFQTFYYDLKQPEHAEIIFKAVEMFKKLYDETPVPDESTLKILEKFPVKRTDNNLDRQLVHNLDRDIISQLKDQIKDEVKQIKIAVPFYDDSLIALRALRDEFHCNDIRLYIQNETSTFPIQFNETYGIVPKESIIPFDSIQINGKNKSGFFHGKVLEFVTDSRTYVLYGSANCSTAALLKTIDDNGNIECDVLEILEENDTSIFNCFVKLRDIPLSNGVFENEAIESSPFRFLYSIVDKGIIRVFIRQDGNHKPLSIELGSVKLDYSVMANQIVLDIPQVLIDDQTAIFDLKVTYDGQSTSVRCWYINQFKLAYFRKNIASYNFAQEVDEKSDQFSEYFSAVIDALFNEEWEEYAEEMRASASAKFAAAETFDPEEDPDTAEDNTDMILERDISDRYVSKNTLFTAAYDVTRQYASKYYGLLAKNDEKEVSGTTIALRVSGSQAVTGTRKATTEDKRLARFIRKHVKKHFLFTDTSMLAYDYYVHLCGIILYIIHNMKYKRKIIDFMNDEEALGIKCTFCRVLLDKYSDQQNDQDRILLIQLVLSTIIELGTYHDAEKDALAKKLLITLNDVAHIRDSYREEIRKLDLSVILDPEIPFSPDKYIGNLFGYKTLSELKQYFNELYIGKCRINDSGNVFEIEIRAKAPTAIADRMIKEVLKYLNEYKRPVKLIRFYYSVPNENDVAYVIKFAGLHINTVKKQIITAKKINEFKCAKSDKNWMPVYFKN